MKKKLLALALAVSAFTSCAYAEQPMAEQYRSWFKKGTFLVSYDADYRECVVSKTLAGYGDMRLERNNIKMKGLASLYVKKEYPDTLYRDGRYYKFETKKKAMVAAEEQLDDPNLDPRAGWNVVRYALALPDEFIPLCAEDRYRSASAAMGMFNYAGSGKKVVAKKEYAYDKYVQPLKSQAGNTLAEVSYYYCYDNDQLAYIEKSLTNGGQEYVIGKMKIKELTNAVPTEMFTMPKGCKVYAAGIGDMDDLLNKPALVEEY